MYIYYVKCVWDIVCSHPSNLKTEPSGYHNMCIYTLNINIRMHIRWVYVCFTLIDTLQIQVKNFIARLLAYKMALRPKAT